MIGFAIPWIFGAALAAALAITALHLLSVRTPRVVLLPTARFVPAREVRAVARQARPNDLLLLAVRVLALLAAGAALAGVRCGTTGARRVALVVADRGRQADSAALRARLVAADRGASGAASGAASGDVAAPTLVWVAGLDDDPGRAIPAAIRAAAQAAQANPSLASVSLTVAMPASVRSRNGWDAWRAEWPAAIRVISATDTGRVTTAPAGAEGDAGGGSDGGSDRDGGRDTDVVRAAFAARRWPVAAGRRVRVRLVRGAEAGAPSSAAGDVTVLWPVNGVPTGWRAVARADSVGALTAAGAVLVAPWRRTALSPPLSPGVVAIAWWGDGVPAAIERRDGDRADGDRADGDRGDRATCTREVAVAVPAGSDLLLAPSADGLLRALQAPCGGVRIPAPREAASATSSRAFVPADHFREASVARRVTQPTWLGPLLLLVALAALLAEPWLRRDANGGTV